MDQITLAFIRFGAFLLAFSSIGTLVGGVWLCILGEWLLFGIGFLAMAVSALPLSIAFVPGLIFGVPAMSFQQRGRMVLASMFGAASIAYTAVVVGIWGGAVLLFCIKAGEASTAWPIFLWGHGVATAPLAVIARSEMESGGNEFSLISLLFLQLGFIGGVIVTIQGKPFERVVFILAASMVVNVVLQCVLAHRGQQRLEQDQIWE